MYKSNKRVLNELPACYAIEVFSYLLAPLSRVFRERDCSIPIPWALKIVKICTETLRLWDFKVPKSHSLTSFFVNVHLYFLCVFCERYQNFWIIFEHFGLTHHAPLSTYGEANWLLALKRIGGRGDQADREHRLSLHKGLSAARKVLRMCCSPQSRRH